MYIFAEMYCSREGGRIIESTQFRQISVGKSFPRTCLGKCFPRRCVGKFFPRTCVGKNSNRPWGECFATKVFLHLLCGIHSTSHYYTYTMFLPLLPWNNTWIWGFDIPALQIISKSTYWPLDTQVDNPIAWVRLGFWIDFTNFIVIKFIAHKNTHCHTTMCILPKYLN